MNLKLLLTPLMFTAVIANAQVAIIDENFESAVVSTPANYDNLVNGWTKKTNVPHNVYVDKNADTGNQFLQFYAAGSTATDVFLISPQIVAPDGSKQIIFDVTPTFGSTVEVALIDNPASLQANAAVPASYQLLQTFTYTQTATTPVSVAPITVPTSSKQYIVVRFRNPQQVGPPGTSHAALAIDNFKYNGSAVLGTSDFLKAASKTQFVITSDNTALQFVAKKDPKNVQVYSALGQKVAEGKLNNQRLDISQLQSGVYFVLIEEADGTATKSKFIKK